MDSLLAMCPLWDALAALTDTDHTDLELCELLMQLYNGSMVDAQSTKWGKEDEFWEAKLAKDGGIMSVVTVPVSLSISIVPTTFTEWELQRLADSENIRALYASISAADAYTVGKLLREIVIRED